MVRYSRFVCAINGSRDDYQVPLALAEANLLNRFVTDYYAPDGAIARLLPGPLKRRQADGLPRRLVRTLPLSFALQTFGRILRLPMQRVFAGTDAMLARAAKTNARRQAAALYCYHMYVPTDVPAGVPLVVFVYHPRAATERRILAADAQHFPEVARSVAEEAIVDDPPIDWQRVDAVVCASPFTAESVIAEGCPPAKITVIPYGLPDVVATGVSVGRETNCSPQFLFVGQGIQRKGLHHLIRAWKSRDRGGARLTIVSYRIDPSIAAMIDDPSITLLGYQDRASLRQLFQRADIFAMPSLLEGFGLVYLEALAHGCHLIGTPNSGLPALNLPKTAATLVEPGNIAALDAAISDSIAACADGAFDRDAIRAASQNWTQRAFRLAISEHARAVLENAGAASKKTALVEPEFS